MSDFTSRFAELYKTKNSTYAAIAEKIGISLRALKYYASGERQPTLPVLIALADYFDVSLDYLCGRSDVKERR